MDVYVVYWQEYTDVSIDGVFSSLKDAMDSCESKKHPKEKWEYQDLFEEWRVPAKKEGAYRIAKCVMRTNKTDE